MEEIIALKENGEVDMLSTSKAKAALNCDYERVLFPVGIDSTIYTCVYPCDLLKKFKKVTIKYVITAASMKTGRGEDEFMGLNRHDEVRYVEFDNLVDFIKLIHSFSKLNSFNIVWEFGGGCQDRMFAVKLFDMDYEYDGGKAQFKLKEKHKKATSDILAKGTFLIATLLFALDKFFEVPENDCRLLSAYRPLQTKKSSKGNLFINEKMTKWSHKKGDLKGQVIQAVDFENSSALTFVNSMVYDLFSGFASGILMICQYNKMYMYHGLYDDDGEEMPVTVDMVRNYSPEYFDLYDLIKYPLTTPGDFVEAISTMLYLCKSVRFLNDLRGTGLTVDHCIVEINCWDKKKRKDGALERPMIFTVLEDDDIESILVDDTLRRFLKELEFYYDTI